MSDTEILCFDYEVNTAGTIARLAIGGRGSQEVLAHANSGFITYEDALDYKMLWTKELYYANYAAQDIRIVSVEISLSLDMVYAGFYNPAMVIQISGATGALLKKKVFYYSTSYVSPGMLLLDIAYLSVIDYVAIYFTLAD